MSEPASNPWEDVELRDLILRNFSGPSPTCEERPMASEEEWGILKTTAITWDGWNERAHKVPPPQYWGKSSIEVNAGDVLITKAGPRHRVGVTAYVNSTAPHLMVSGKMIGLRPNPRRVIPRLLADMLATREVQEYLDSRTTGMAESQTNISDEALLRTPVRVPPMREQRRIVEILDALDDQLQATGKIIDKLKRLRDGLLSELFGAVSTAENRVLDDCLSRIDAGWSPDCPETSPDDGQWGVLKVSAVSGGIYRPAESKALPSSLRPRPGLEVRSGDVLCVRANGVGGLVGRVVFVEATPPRLMLSDKTLRLVPRSELDSGFLALAMATPYARRQIEAAMGGSSSQKNISQAELRRLLLPIPPRYVQAKVVERVRSLDRTASENQWHLEKLRLTRSGLMRDLLTGVVRVPVVAA